MKKLWIFWGVITKLDYIGGHFYSLTSGGYFQLALLTSPKYETAKHTLCGNVKQNECRSNENKETSKTLKYAS